MSTVHHWRTIRCCRVEEALVMAAAVAVVVSSFNYLPRFALNWFRCRLRDPSVQRSLVHGEMLTSSSAVSDSIASLLPPCHSVSLSICLSLSLVCLIGLVFLSSRPRSSQLQCYSVINAILCSCCQRHISTVAAHILTLPPHWIALAVVN